MQDRIALTCICPLCQKILKNPIVFSCAHNFCMVCAESILFSSKSSPLVLCPECQKPLKITPHSKNWLTKNRVLEKLIDTLKDPLCGLCRDKPDFCCVICRVFMCDPCSSKHRQGRYKCHPVESLNDYYRNYCFDHGYKKNVFCMTEKVLLCIRCSIFHNKHEIISVEDASVLLNSQIEALVSKIEAFMSELATPVLLKHYISCALSKSKLGVFQYTNKINLTATYDKKPSDEVCKDLFYINRSSVNALKYTDLSSLSRPTSGIIFPKWCGFTLLPNNKILITGGKGNKESGSTSSAYILDSNLVMLSKLNMIYGHSSHVTVLKDNKVYILAGKNTENVAGNHCESFDIETFKFNAIQNMHYGRTCPAGACTNAEIYVIGGFTHGISNNIEKYNISNNSWTDFKITLPVRLFQAGAIAIDDHQIIILGGEITSEILNLHSFVFNTLTESFGACSKLKKKNAWLGCWYQSIIHNGFLYSLSSKSLIQYNLSTRYWDSKKVPKVA